MSKQPTAESTAADPAAAPVSRMRVKQVPIANLVPYAPNARQHPKKQIDGIAASIREFGFNAPVPTASMASSPATPACWRPRRSA